MVPWAEYKKQKAEILTDIVNHLKTIWRVTVLIKNNKLIPNYHWQSTTYTYKKTMFYSLSRSSSSLRQSVAEGLMLKIGKTFPKKFLQILSSQIFLYFLGKWVFQLKEMRAGVPQWSVLGLSDLPAVEDTRWRYRTHHSYLRSR